MNHPSDSDLSTSHAALGRAAAQLDDSNAEWAQSHKLAVVSVIVDPTTMEPVAFSRQPCYDALTVTQLLCEAARYFVKLEMSETAEGAGEG